MATDPFRPYISHKRVEAARIVSLAPGEPSATVAGKDIAVELEGGAVLQVAPLVFARYMPDPGDYLVRYADGYLSVSPKAAFEDGYRLAPTLVSTNYGQPSGDLVG